MNDQPTGSYDTSDRSFQLLEALTLHAEQIDGVRRKDLRPGDRVIVSTRNSIYSITATDEDAYDVAGGWFDRQGNSPIRLEINGCTAGGSALFRRMLAAPGLFLEFANGVKTTRIRTVRLLRATA
jgi:hypothetical protein